MAEMTGAWLTVQEAAELARVSPWSLYRAAELGELRHVRIGGRRAIRLSRQAVDEWMLRYEQEPQPVRVDPGGALRRR